MGQKQSQEEEGQVPEDDMEELKAQTEFSAKEIQEYYEKFNKDFPSGYITRSDFVNMYCEMYTGSGDARRFAEYIFKAHDIDKSGAVDFKEFMTTLSVSQRGSVEDRLNWAFNMYDLNGDGFLSRREASEIISAIYRMRGRSDRQSAEDAALKVFIALDKNQDDRLTRDEFVTGCKKCGSLLDLIEEQGDE